MELSWMELSKVQFGMSTVLAMVTAFLLFVIWLWHKDSHNRIDVKDLICTDGHLDEKKFVRFGAWIVSTWGFVYLIVDERFSEWYFMGYMTAWVGNALLDKYMNVKSEPNGKKPDWKKYDQ